MSRVAGVVLAAGSGSRMGVPKAALVVSGARLLDRSVGALAGAGCAPVVAVVRAGTSAPEPARAVVNPEPERGMRSSLQLGVDAAAAAEAIAVLLVDTPGIGVDAVRAVLRGWAPGRIAVGRYAGRRGHPTVMSPALWQEALLLAAPDEGARALLAARADLVDEIDVPGRPDDLDTPDDLARWEGGGMGHERDRLQILDALAIALERRAELMDVVSGARDADQARSDLMTRFDLTDVQAAAVLDLQVRRFSELERGRIVAEREELRARLGAP